MAIVQIPVRSDTTNYDMRVDLDGVTYVLAFRYNSRDGFWYLSVLDSDEDPIRSGIRLVLGTSYLRLVVSSIRPAGDLVAVDDTGTGTEAGASDFGTRVALLYAERADVEAALS